ncbi:hypothetical protein [Allobranchiibius sp. GilTou73]|uniref:hypothetical protein n=1 Tax=Allobranchiibius sp. GilTou73 TaxID=2904523 RepID=UPI001F3D8F1F|nr:hypothetical protein [Allobranchiibius sp. GilTou73]UIJ33912.1 hypothetical protein LVQ62_12275 [Allobranchiibius sp. GilTou73]
MPISDVLQHPVHTYVQAAGEIEPARAESRMSAYIYGDILVLAATAGVSRGDIHSGKALLVVLGTVLSTYIAHALADIVGAALTGHSLSGIVGHELRDSIPVASAGMPSLALLGAAALGWPAALWAQSLACAVLIARLGLTGLVYRRLHSGMSVHRGVRFGIAVALVAAVVVAIKLALTH